MKERRQHKRLTIMGLIRGILPGETRAREVYLSNISRGGIGIYLHREVKVGQKVALLVMIRGAEGVDREEQIPLRVAWSTRTGRLHMAGLKYIRMTEKRYQEILRSLSVVE